MTMKCALNTSVQKEVLVVAQFLQVFAEIADEIGGLHHDGNVASYCQQPVLDLRTHDSATLAQQIKQRENYFI